MPRALPSDLRWGDFVRVLSKLGYSLYENKRGSARTFHNPFAAPERQFVTFHEPHGSNRIRKGTLREYVSKLGLEHDNFLAFLDQT
jgi:predicted RNA binding protein YcfA (HicA-like mRNA interferase family)